jgi:uncharacterized Zn finger protein
MGVKKSETVSRLEKYECDECGGNVNTTSVVFNTHPPQYEHQCASCGKRYILDAVYPRVAFEESTKAKIFQINEARRCT